MRVDTLGLCSVPDDALGVSSGGPAVEGAVEDPEGPCDALAFDPGRRLLLLLEEGVGDEVGHLEQAVGVGAAEGGAADDPLYGDAPGALAVLPDLIFAGHGVAAPEPAVEAGHHLLAALVEDEEGVAVRRRDGGVDAVEEPVEAGPLVAFDVGLAQADVDDLNCGKTKVGFYPKRVSVVGRQRKWDTRWGRETR